MAGNRPQRPKDANQLAKLVIDIATGNVPDTLSAPSPMSVLGREGGRKGGAARAAALTPKRRREIAQRAAELRWKKHEPKE